MYIVIASYCEGLQRKNKQPQPELPERVQAKIRKLVEKLL
jgi:hypothetical protein